LLECRNDFGQQVGARIAGCNDSQHPRVRFAELLQPVSRLCQNAFGPQHVIGQEVSRRRQGAAALTFD
jgi:hypothetical protein